MGQSAFSPRTCDESLAVSVFSTAIGWVGLAGHGKVLCSLVFGYDSQAEVLSRFSSELAANAALADWNPALRKRLQSFLKGAGAGSFEDVATVVTESTPFASKVIDAVKRIPPGRVKSYAEVAAAAGSPKASRAVGNIMARNTIPIIIPCHRVVASGGRLGGYSSPKGLDLKTRLLNLEAGLVKAAD